MTGLWFDLLLLALLAATAVLLYRQRSTEPALATDDGGGTTSAWPLRSRFPAAASQAGFEPDALFGFYWLAKLGLALALPLGILELVRPSADSVLFWILGVGLFGFFLPDLGLYFRRRQRQRRIRQALSYFLDLLVALLYSGLSLEEAFRRAGREGLDRSHPLAREVRRVSSELDAGRERGETFRALAERTGVAELRAVAAALNLASRHGTSVETALETQAELLRTKRRENARREITAAATRSLFPLFLCGVPVFLVIIFFPAILELIETFRAFAALF